MLLVINRQHFLFKELFEELKAFVKISNAAKVNSVPAINNVIVCFVGYVTVPQLGRCALFVGMQFNGYYRGLVLPVEIPLLHNFFVLFKLQVFTYNAAIPKAKLAARFGRHFGRFAGPEL